MTTTTRRLLLVPLIAGLILSGCGGDEPPPTPKKAGASSGGGGGTKKAAAPAKKKKKGKGKGLVTYPRIEEKYRRPLVETDFLPDPTGEERRDPFQSFVVRQGGPRQPRNTAAPIQQTDLCTEKNIKARGYLLRDLRLIGIVLLGTNSFAQFKDKSGFGWVVKRGDCVGKEKAIVQAVGVGSVTLEVIPETPPNAPPPPPQRRDVALYPEDLDPMAAIDDAESGDGTTAVGEGAAPPAE